MEVLSATPLATGSQPTKPTNMKKLLDQLKKLGIAVTSTQPWSPVVDGEIQLGGEYKSCHVQVGRGYYEVGRVKGTGKKCRIFYIRGKGNLASELQTAMAKVF